MTSSGDTWSPDEPGDTETFEQSDEAAAEAERVDPEYLEASELDPSLDPSGVFDEVEAQEAGVLLDDPERLAILPGGGDDPDGVGGLPDRG